MPYVERDAAHVIRGTSDEIRRQVGLQLEVRMADPVQAGDPHDVLVVDPVQPNERHDSDE
jgi:hypothetical protein